MRMDGVQIELRPFQAKEIPKLQDRKRSGIVWDMGLGKTVALGTIGAKAQLRRWLVICPDNAFSVWGTNPKFPDRTIKDYIRAHEPDIPVRCEAINGTPWERDLQWATPYEAGGVHIRVCTYDTFIRDWRRTIEQPGKKKRTVQFIPRKNYHIPEIVVLDESRRIRSKDTQAFKTIDRFLNYYNPPYLYLTTGTPGHEPKHFWTMLNLINRKYFRSYWDFVKAFHYVDELPFGTEVNEPKNLDAFHNLLKRHASIIKEEDVEQERPPLTRQLLPIEMDEDQKKLYEDFLEEAMHWVDEDQKLLVAQNELTKLTRMRQALVCPKILSPSLGVGNAIKDFIQTVDPKDHTVIFTPYIAAFPHFREFLAWAGWNRNLYFFQGGMGTDERDLRLQAFRSTGGTCICSILYAQAFSFEPATKCFFIGYDWDPDNNRQAEKRLHRLTTQNPVAAYYYTFRTTFDERLAEIVNIKQQHVNITMPSQLRAYMQ